MSFRDIDWERSRERHGADALPIPGSKPIDRLQQAHRQIVSTP